jgi:hypothetical protein
MPAADVGSPTEHSEIERIERWRSAELERAGFSTAHAAQIAARHDIDLHFAVDLVKSGCPPDVAFSILI